MEGGWCKIFALWIFNFSNIAKNNKKKIIRTKIVRISLFFWKITKYNRSNVQKHNHMKIYLLLILQRASCNTFNNNILICSNLSEYYTTLISKFSNRRFWNFYNSFSSSSSQTSITPFSRKVDKFWNFYNSFSSTSFFFFFFSNFYNFFFSKGWKVK